MSKPFAGFPALVRSYPARTAVLSVTPVVVAVAQAANAVVHGAQSPLVAAFILAMLCVAAAATRQSLASFRVETLEAGVADDAR
ncbi:hypothetical protein [Halogeometricum sp. CBA1124]|uniref:hypothetical protein n=1 Tax=Halogeometricum sp. CBA1124 TaxID=2668071 RepID=UPI001429DEC4|nr:hypothetical protein [Halogeometricum sp. CBA1124]MUV56112.1 hypothetical protein [Halogeometricum sp. CBA1124]